MNIPNKYPTFKMGHVSSFIGVSMISAILMSTPINAQQASFSGSSRLEVVPGQLLVKFKPGVQATYQKRFLASQNLVTLESFSILDAKVVRISTDEDPIAAARRLAKLPNVEIAEPNYVVYAIGSANDPKFSQQWGLPKIKAPTAWDVRKDSPNVVVAVIDTGVDYNHPDLKANMWKNPGEIPGNNIDDDGNGVVDDVHGANVEATTPTGDPLDDNNHGSHVAGIISAVTNNNVGIAGTSWKTQIMAVKFLSASGSGSTAGAIRAIEYATKNGAHIMNNSWGGGGSSQLLKAVIEAANAKGILFTAAAGNKNPNGNDNDANPHFPSNYDVPNVLSVMATDKNDKRAGFSHYGKTTVDLAAPGVDILSTVKQGGYASFNGTSMATPFVSGAAALVKAANPTWSAVKIKSHLMTTAEVIPALSGLSVTGARLDLAKALPRGTAPGCKNAHALIAYNEFFFPAKRTFSSNSNVLSVNFNLPRSMIVDVSAHGSAQRVRGNGITSFRTGVYKGASTNSMWTGSYRKGTYQDNKTNLTVSSNYSIRLPAGSHTLYWKLWLSGFSMQFDSGNLTVRAFPCSMGGKIKSTSANGKLAITSAVERDVVLESKGESEESVTGVMETTVQNTGD